MLSHLNGSDATRPGSRHHARAARRDLREVEEVLEAADDRVRLAERRAEVHPRDAEPGPTEASAVDEDLDLAQRRFRGDGPTRHRDVGYDPLLFRRRVQTSNDV